MGKKMRMIALLLSVAMIAVLFAGCGGNEQPSDGGQSSEQGQGTEQQSETTEGGGINKEGFPIVNEQITLRILRQKETHEIPCEDMELLKEYEKMTNINIEWDNPPVESFTERYNIVMASGDLPDVIINMPAADILKYGQMGAIVSLNDLIDKYSPNFKKLMASDEEIRKQITQSDGSIYGLPMIRLDPRHLVNMPLQIRQDWLKKLNLQMPVTTEDWYKVWKAFKEQDPNSNGKTDEIPFSGNDINSTSTGPRALIPAWGVQDGFYPVNGEIHYGPIEERYKEAVTWIVQMYKEGLIDQEIATNDEKAFQGKVAQDLVGSYRGLLGGHWGAFNQTLPKSIPGLHYAIVEQPMKGPYGDQIHPWIQPKVTGLGMFTITKANKYLEATMRWVDYFYSKEGSLFIGMEGDRYEGVYWEMKNGVRWLKDDLVAHNKDGLSAKQVVGKITPAQGAWPMLQEYLMGFMEEGLENEQSKAKMELGKYVEKTEILPPLAFQQEDDEVRRQLMADIQTYVDEQIVKFILGQEPLSKWDEYVKQIKDMGIDEVISIYQKAYNEYQQR